MITAPKRPFYFSNNTTSNNASHLAGTQPAAKRNAIHSPHKKHKLLEGSTSYTPAEGLCGRPAMRPPPRGCGRGASPPAAGACAGGSALPLKVQRAGDRVAAALVHVAVLAALRDRGVDLRRRGAPRTHRHLLHAPAPTRARRIPDLHGLQYGTAYVPPVLRRFPCPKRIRLSKP